jgi:hypothetical protein
LGTTKLLKALHEDRFSEIFETTINDMKKLGTYKEEFSPIITRYAEMRFEFEILMQRWYAKGCKITENYTNKSGATNERKTALYLAIENLRRELTELENIFGLTPAGLKKIDKKGLGHKKESSLAKALSGIE